MHLFFLHWINLLENIFVLLVALSKNEKIRRFGWNNWRVLVTRLPNMQHFKEKYTEYIPKKQYKYSPNVMRSFTFSGICEYCVKW